MYVGSRDNNANTSIQLCRLRTNTYNVAGQMEETVMEDANSYSRSCRTSILREATPYTYGLTIMYGFLPSEVNFWLSFFATSQWSSRRLPL